VFIPARDLGDDDVAGQEAIFIHGRGFFGRPLELTGRKGGKECDAGCLRQVNDLLWDLSRCLGHCPIL
jgi:hypothetical protein